ncbi:hypothetical protein SAMD00019534_068390 [Acytostelium subglobosum LB1]|uniref:hypothetical protein n=1 Tax=Acytostelium subglobosum LB1 TaxID=1410327 RepID=UPI0006447C15|nr:hypothetical protein SAMD00019534_068390 [Acytostelium subglobosum LB1]GAM23664.1 hypothetical protein SAMD00019534_068390 [Acytostelium subglobosum LB1]|eukprot:XP_012753405.1 hypothetical protein SAMD00019534_068390 [Acytostelium subglobosum LB1]
MLDTECLNEVLTSANNVDRAIFVEAIDIASASLECANIYITTIVNVKLDDSGSSKQIDVSFTVEATCHACKSLLESGIEFPCTTLDAIAFV